MVSRNWNRVWVVGTVTLISFISFSSQIFVVWPQYGSTVSVDLLKLLLPFNFLIFMVFWNYRLCVITPPGGVPQGWRPNLSALENMEVKTKNHAPRYCKTCEHYKPPRAHHCRTCKTCVLKLDHHCPWIANCVGFHNQGHFIRFLLWVDLATSYHIMLLIHRVLDFSRSFNQEPSLRDMLFLIFNFAACVPVWICVGMFSLYHVYLASGNSTTVEGWEKDKVATLIRRGKIKEVKYPYDIGMINNLKSVLGQNPLLWLWPQKMQGDGLSFSVNPAAGASNVQYLWPPPDPTQRDNPPMQTSRSPFIYGEESLNPALRPSNSQIRSRGHDHRGGISSSGEYVSPWHTEIGSDGEERQAGSERSSSSPEPYLSDYDDENVGPLGKGERMPRVRRGSEGWEVKPSQAWGSGMGLSHGGLEDDPQGRVGARPWEESGRYNVYEPYTPQDRVGATSGRESDDDV